MKYSEYLAKLRKKGSSKVEVADLASQPKEPTFDPDLLGVDMFCLLSYMSAIATARLPRHQLFAYAADLPYVSSRYFKRVQGLAQKLNYDYAEACRLVGQSTKESEPKHILLRFSGALAAGDSEVDFLVREAEVSGRKYGEGYERKVESMKKWTETYVALMMSSSLIVVVGLVSQLIFPIPGALMASMIGLVFLATLAGVWVLFRSAPKEVKTHRLPQKSLWRGRANNMARLLLPSAAVTAIILLLAGASLGWVLIIVALLVFPIGLAITLDDRAIDRQDSDIAGFLRGLGGIASAIGATLTEAIERIDLDSLGYLKKGVTRLHTALRFGLNPKLCWDRFVGETGSESVNRAVRVFWDSIALGGDSQKAGVQSSLFAVEVSLLRDKRKQVSSSFSYLCLIMHITVGALMIGIFEVLQTFGKLAQGMGDMSATTAEALSQLPTFQILTNGDQMQRVLGTVVTAVLLMFIVANPIAIKVVDGGHNYKYFFYLSIMMLASGATMVITPSLVAGVFSGLSMPAA